jgi:hypothetical protein
VTHHLAPLIAASALGALAAAAADVPHVANPAEPRDGREVLETRELWNRGHQDDEEIFFGAINTVEVGPDGGIYVLDTQRAQVCVFDERGELMRILSREGDGPGETRRPEDLVFLPDGSLGIALLINGKIVRIDLDGTPRGSLMPPGPAREEGGISSIRRVRYRAGTFVINGTRVQQGEDGMARTQYLDRCDESAQTVAVYHSTSRVSNLLRDGFVERLHYFPSHERWDIDFEGRVLAAVHRNDYLVNVYAADGELLRTFGRDCEPWQRTEAEKQLIRDSIRVMSEGRPVSVPVELEDEALAIERLHAMPGGEIWVLPTRGFREQPEGVMMTFDVFDRDLVFVRRVAIALDADPDDDKLVFLEGRRLALIRGQQQARRNTYGGTKGEVQDVEVNDLTIYAY